MAADGNLLKGEVAESPSNEQKNVDALLEGFLLALLREQEVKKADEVSES